MDRVNIGHDLAKHLVIASLFLNLRKTLSDGGSARFYDVFVKERLPLPSTGTTLTLSAQSLGGMNVSIAVM
jgi:hypothetical protein